MKNRKGELGLTIDIIQWVVFILIILAPVPCLFKQISMLRESMNLPGRVQMLVEEILARKRASWWCQGFDLRLSIVKSSGRRRRLFIFRSEINSCLANLGWFGRSLSELCDKSWLNHACHMIGGFAQTGHQDDSINSTMHQPFAETKPCSCYLPAIIVVRSSNFPSLDRNSVLGNNQY